MYLTSRTILRILLIKSSVLIVRVYLQKCKIRCRQRREIIYRSSREDRVYSMNDNKKVGGRECASFDRHYRVRSWKMGKSRCPAAGKWKTDPSYDFSAPRASYTSPFRLHRRVFLFLQAVVKSRTVTKTSGIRLPDNIDIYRSLGDSGHLPV